MKKLNYVLPIVLLGLFFFKTLLVAQTPAEQPLWPEGIPDNPVKYTKEKVRDEKANAGSLSQKNRVFSQVSNPSYRIFQPEQGEANGVAVVICPGGGFRDVWFDREGVDFAMWLAEKGITSLVLKYRTYNSDAEGFSLDRNLYNVEVYTDAKQAIHILRSRADELNIDKKKIGIGGYSAGGALALYASLEIFENELPAYAGFNQNTSPNFAFLIYPGISQASMDAAKQKESIPPMFMINGAEDDVTPADRCLELYGVLLKKNIPAEIHVYSKGGHGFDSGMGRGKGIASWQDSFLNWLKDMKF